MVLSKSQYRSLPPNNRKVAASTPTATTKKKQTPLQRCHSLLNPLEASAKRANASSNNTHKRRMRKAVSFSEASNKRVVVPTTDDEKQNKWYNRNEYREFRDDIQATALSVRLGISDFIDAEDFCLRGLEANLSPDTAVLRRLRRQLLVESILREQRAQRTVGAVNHEVIRELSTVLSTDSMVDAVKRGVSDAHEGVIQPSSRPQPQGP